MRASETQLARLKYVTPLKHVAAGDRSSVTCSSHPERVVLLGQVGEDVGVEQSGVKKAAPQRRQLGAELAHVPADLLRHLLVVFLHLMKEEKCGLCGVFFFVLFWHLHQQLRLCRETELLPMKVKKIEKTRMFFFF